MTTLRSSDAEKSEEIRTLTEQKHAAVTAKVKLDLKVQAQSATIADLQNRLRNTEATKTAAEKEMYELKLRVADMERQTQQNNESGSPRKDLSNTAGSKVDFERLADSALRVLFSFVPQNALATPSEHVQAISEVWSHCQKLSSVQGSWSSTRVQEILRADFQTVRKSSPKSPTPLVIDIWYNLRTPFGIISHDILDDLINGLDQLDHHGMRFLVAALSDGLAKKIPTWEGATLPWLRLVSLFEACRLCVAADASIPSMIQHLQDLDIDLLANGRVLLKSMHQMLLDRALGNSRMLKDGLLPDLSFDIGGVTVAPDGVDLLVVLRNTTYHIPAAQFALRQKMGRCEIQVRGLDKDGTVDSGKYLNINWLNLNNYAALIKVHKLFPDMMRRFSDRVVFLFADK